MLSSLMREDFHRWLDRGFLSRVGGFVLPRVVVSDRKSASSTAAIRSRLNFILRKFRPLAAAPPHADACKQDQQRNSNHAAVKHHAHLLLRHVQAAIFVFTRANRDQISSDESQLSVLSQQIGIEFELDKSVGRPARIPDHDELSLAVFLAGVVSARGAQRQRSLNIVLAFDDLARVQILQT
jgi:hypothetical protein